MSQLFLKSGNMFFILINGKVVIPFYIVSEVKFCGTCVTMSHTISSICCHLSASRNEVSRFVCMNLWMQKMTHSKSYWRYVAAGKAALDDTLVIFLHNNISLASIRLHLSQTRSKNYEIRKKEAKIFSQRELLNLTPFLESEHRSIFFVSVWGTWYMHPMTLIIITKRLYFYQITPGRQYIRFLSFFSLL